MDWVDHIADQTLLCNVDTLRLKVVAPSAQSMGEFLVRKFDSENPPRPEETPESEEAERIISRLRLLPGLRHFAILKHTDRDAEANDKIFEPILSFIIRGDNMPLLESLTLHNHKIPLSFLLPSSHQNLHALNLTGFSVTGPDVAREVLRRLPKLKELVLVGPPPELEFLQRPGYRGVPVVQSIIPRVIASLRELRALSLHEIRDGSMSSAGGRLAFFTAEMLDAVTATHHRSLRHLSLQTNQALEQRQQQQPLSSSSSPPSESNNNDNSNNEKPTDVLRSIKSLLGASHFLKTVSLAWYDLNPTILHFLPPSLQHLEISLPVGGHDDDDDDGGGDALISTLINLHRSNCLPHLRSVVLRYYTGNSPVSIAKGFMPTPSRATGQPARRPLIEVEVGPVVRARLEVRRRRLVRALGGLRVDACRWGLGYEDV
ncbi:hypothetical protein VTN00DRAFT_2889 [Thermoascus crustaceus]|uniref:uncharacterized protein n=1 Tax=Thermoascus crustaceus TaxID=5088 RepID=UPI003744838D